jgi:hypothetical protein
MIRDATGINEVMDASSPKGEQLVGVRQQAMQAANNALYDITNASMVLYRRVCEDIVKCLQIIPVNSVLYRSYENAIGKENMKVLSSFKDLPMYNFGVRVVTEMNDQDKAYLEQNIQVALSTGEIDLEDAIAVRQLRDVDQAEKLLVVRRKKRIKQRQEIATQNSQMQSQANIQTAQATAQGEAQLEQIKSQLEMQRMQMEAQIQAQMMQMEYGLKMQLEQLKLGVQQQQDDQKTQQMQAMEEMKEEKKDERINKQAVAQSKLISQRQGKRPELTDEQEDDIMKILAGE